jgi:hypothetical protein
MSFSILIDISLMTSYTEKLKIGGNISHMQLSHIQLTLTILPCKQSWMVLDSLLLVTEYNQQWNQSNWYDWFKQNQHFAFGSLVFTPLFPWIYYLCSFIQGDSAYK